MAGKPVKCAGSHLCRCMWSVSSRSRQGKTGCVSFFKHECGFQAVKYGDSMSSTKRGQAHHPELLFLLEMHGTTVLVFGNSIPCVCTKNGLLQTD